ncbi:nucleoside hydrolase [Deinococcus sp. Arct2-2]|uniref:nucleoside hydrolase n=1 Tax=Deinococcus sp. Arct2-2 TaxID=2568653 RepID=UPI0010A56E86|nr:nucleoside hydrolase [Deinococcus sp. Arct2-2]THF66034.1 nucleoside hydrolase [Deinococcus sp. Arct2-2]
MTSSPLPKPIILDGDPGLDDAVAWMLALASPAEVQVLGVCSVHGNVPLERTSHNAGVILALTGEAGRTVPHYAGADRPLVREAMTAAAVHGDSGLPAAGLPAPVREPEALHAALFMIQAIRAQPGEVTLIATGPLTNVALAFRLAPDLPAKVREVVWMGGSTAHGNRTPAAEFNALADPHAAHVVLSSGAQVRMVGLNLTMQSIATPDRLDDLRALGNRAGAVCAELLTFYAVHYRARYGLNGGALHDPVAVAAVVRPELFTFRPMRVQVETQDGLNFGRTVCDLYGKPEPTECVQVGLELDEPAFFALLLERVGRLP